MTLPARIQQYKKPERHDEAPEFTVGAMESVHRVLLSGDTHGDENHVRWLLQHAKKVGADALFVLGDFGVWDHMDAGAFTGGVSKWAQRLEVPVFFLPGNHDNYDLLFQWEADKPRTRDGFLEVRPGLFYSPRGHRWTWGGTRFMSLGGAYSVDKRWRVQQDHTTVFRAEMHKDQGRTLRPIERYALQTGQLSWWSQEEISQEELDYALRPGEIDILLTHDKPRLSHPDWNRKDLEECWSNQEAIQEVVDAKKPKLLVHGHLHWPYDQYLPNGTYVKALDCDPEASKHSGGTGMKTASIAVLDLDKALTIDDETHQGFTITWSGKTFSGWSDAIEKNFSLFEEKLLEAGE